MPLLHIVLIALIQGITEFLPVSSSGHLVLFHGLIGERSAQADQINLLLDIAVHVGTLLAVCLYFWRDIWQMTKGLGTILTGRFDDTGARLNIHILISSIPVIAAGFALHAINPFWLREVWVVAAATIIFGALLWYADERPTKENAPNNRGQADMTWRDALWIGCAQILALIPGTSRSGITMTVSRFLGFTRTEAARYSLLLSTIAISGAGTLGAADVVNIASPALAIAALQGIVISFIAALAAIALMMRWLKTQTFRIFAIYRFALGGALIAALGMGWI